MPGLKHESVLTGHPAYDFVRDLTPAEFGFVVLAKDKGSGELVAIRFFDNRLQHHGSRAVQWIPLEDKDCLSGIAQQMQLQHPCILIVKEAIACPPYVGLVMEYAQDGDLWEYVVARGGLPEPEARRVFQQAVLAMAFCHAKGVSCKDIQLKHAFLSHSGGQPLIKLRQFDYLALLQDLQGQFPRSRTGDYLAPEAITCLQGEADTAADAWAAGVMLYALLFAHHPFERAEDACASFSRRVQTTVRRILEVDYTIPASPPISEGCRALIARLLVKDPAQRLPFNTILQDAWFKQDLSADLLVQHERALGSKVHIGQTEEQLRAIMYQVVAANAKAAVAQLTANH